MSTLLACCSEQVSLRDDDPVRVDVEVLPRI